MQRGRTVRLLVAVACATLSLAALGLGSAQAAETHPFLSSFDGAGSTAGAFENLDRLALRQSSGDAYAIDRGHAVNLSNSPNPADIRTGRVATRLKSAPASHGPHRRRKPPVATSLPPPSTAPTLQKIPRFS